MHWQLPCISKSKLALPMRLPQHTCVCTCVYLDAFAGSLQSCIHTALLVNKVASFVGVFFRYMCVLLYLTIGD